MEYFLCSYYAIVLSFNGGVDINSIFMRLHSGGVREGSSLLVVG
jgi:hypothetical protein